MLYIFGLVLFSTIAWLIYYLRSDNEERGEAEEKAKAIGDMLDDVYLAKKARDAITANPNSDAARKLRQKYERR